MRGVGFGVSSCILGPCPSKKVAEPSPVVIIIRQNSVSLCRKANSLFTFYTVFTDLMCNSNLLVVFLLVNSLV